jgi:hypothetical protein
MAFTTTALGLTVWNSPSDKYNYQQLADNWLRVEEHDHTPGKGNPIQTDSIADGAITSSKIASGVISANVQANSVGTEALINNSVTRSKIANEAVTYNKLHPHARMPLGTIVPWWHPTPTDATLVSLFGVDQDGLTIPSWVICDGRILPPGRQDFVNADFTVPNLQSRFIMGASGTIVSGSSTVTALTIVECSENSRTFKLNSSSGLSPNTTYLISAPSVFGANTTFTTEASLSATNTYVASNNAKIGLTTLGTPISATITSNPNAATTTGGLNTVSLAHSHSFAHTHQVPAHRHSVTGITEDTNHRHSTPNRTPFVRAASSGNGSSSNFKTESGAAHRYTTSVTSGPIHEDKTRYSVSGYAGSLTTPSGDEALTSTQPNSQNTSTSLADFENRPNYISVMYIMKVKN